MVRGIYYNAGVESFPGGSITPKSKGRNNAEGQDAEYLRSPEVCKEGCRLGKPSVNCNAVLVVLHALE